MIGETRNRASACRMKRDRFAVVVLLSLVAGCGRRTKPAPPAAAAPALPLFSALKAASSLPQDPVAKAAAGRLERATAADGALNDPEKLADVCLHAGAACGFELRGDVWNRPESQARRAGVTAARALAEFMGKDYRLVWVGPVAHVFPAETDGLLPLDTAFAAAAGANAASGDAAATIREIAVKLDLAMLAPGPRAAPAARTSGSVRDYFDSLCGPATPRPSSYVAVYGPGRAGSLRWYDGAARP
jgi:hypothetical protein